MADFGRVKTWGNEVLQPADLNAEFDNIINNVTSNTIDAANIDETAAYTWSGATIVNAAWTFNENSADVDLRAEGANNANMIVLDGGQDALSFGGANVDGTAFALNNLTSRTHITSVGSQFHVPAQTTNFDNSSGTIAIGSGAFFGIPTWTNANSTLTMTNAATVYIQGPPVDSTNVTATNTAKALWVDAGLTALDGAVTMGSTITGAGVLSIDDTTESTSTTTGSIHTDGGLGVAGDIYAGDDIFFTSAAVLNFHSGDMTVTHGSNVLTVAGGTWATAALTASTITGSGVLSIDDTTESTSTTTGSIHTDGGLGVAGDIYAGDDIFLTSGAVLNFAAGSETITHSANTITVGGVTTWASSATTHSFDGAVSIDTSGNNNLTLDAGTADIIVATGSGASVLGGGPTALDTDVTNAVGSPVYFAASTPTSDQTFVGIAQGANTSGVGFYGLKTRGSGTAADTIVVDGDDLVTISGQGADGTDYHTAGQIKIEVDGTPSDGTDMPGRISFWTTPDGSATVSQRASISSAGRMEIGSGSENAFMTAGLLINQSTLDDEILALQSETDVNHGMTDFADHSTFLSIKKANTGTGGAQIAVYGEGNAGLDLHVRQGAIVTTDTSSSTGAVTIKGQQWDGGTGVINAPATSNVLAVTDGANTRFIVKGNGAIHATNVTSGSGDLDGTALDGEDDIGLIRAFERTVHSDLGIIMSKWDEEVQAHADDLRRVGVFKGDFYCMQRMDSLLGGGVWQNHCRIQELREVLDSTRKELAETQAQLRRISA